MGLKESLEAWKRNADIACLIARMSPEGGVEHVLDRDHKKLAVNGGPIHVLYLLENGTYRINTEQEGTTVVASNAPKIVIMDTVENKLYTAGTRGSIELVKIYLEANPERAVQPGVLELAAKIIKQGPDPEAINPSRRSAYIPIAIIEIQNVGKYRQ